jgi:hypothetical protein
MSMAQEGKPRYLAKFAGQKILHDSPCVGLWEYGGTRIFRLGPYQSRGRAVIEMNALKEKEYALYDFISSIDDIVRLPEGYKVWQHNSISLCAKLEHDICAVAKVGWKEHWPFSDEDTHQVFSKASENIAACYESIESGILANAGGFTYTRSSFSKGILAMLRDEGMASACLTSTDCGAGIQDLQVDTLADSDIKTDIASFIKDDDLRRFFESRFIRSSIERYSRPELTRGSFLLYDSFTEFIKKEKII